MQTAHQLLSATAPKRRELGLRVEELGQTYHHFWKNNLVIVTPNSLVMPCTFSGVSICVRSFFLRCTGKIIYFVEAT